MKPTKLILIGVALLTLAATVRSDKAPSHQVVILEAYEAIYPGPTYKGVVVYNSSSSQGAPTFPCYPNPMVQLSDAIAQLLDDGFTYTHDGLTYTFTK